MPSLSVHLSSESGCDSVMRLTGGVLQGCHMHHALLPGQWDGTDVITLSARERK